MQAFRHQPIDACTRSPVPTIDKHTFASKHACTHAPTHIIAPACKHARLLARTHTRTHATDAHTRARRMHTCTSYKSVHLINIIITLLLGLQFQIGRWVKCKMRRVPNFTLTAPHSCLFVADGSTAMRKRPSYTLTCWFMCNHNYASRQSSPRYRQHINIALLRSPLLRRSDSVYEWSSFLNGSSSTHQQP